MIDEKINFKKINISVITLSDTRNFENDKSGKTLKDLIVKKGHHVSHYQIIEDEPSIFIPVIVEITKSKNQISCLKINSVTPRFRCTRIVSMT